ncbi:MAG TPA: tetratricopeptide repeat protein, partial [Chitinispirillaceae bacterium]|nr:tetratricopeptide repeat protein [Chitinispirillaceae bacterium]
AKDLLDKYCNIYHDEWEIYFLYSRLYSETDEPQKTIQCLHKGLKFDKTNPDLLMGLFFTHSMLHDPQKGGRYLLRAVKHHPSNEQVLSSLIWYYTEINQIDNAITVFERLHSEGTFNPETYRNGGIAYQKSGRYDEAEQAFKTAIQLSEQFEEVVDMLADLYIFQEKTDKAIDLYKEILKKSSKNLRILSKMVFCHLQAEEYEPAANVAKDMIRLYPNSPSGYIDFGYVCLNTKEYDKAIEHANKALDITPLDSEAKRLKGLVFAEQGNTAQADEAFEAAIALDPENIEIVRDYYNHLHATGRYEKMLNWINTAILNQHPDCVEEYWFLADYYREQGENYKSFQHLHKAYKLMPSENDLMPLMAEILIDEGHIGFSYPILLKYVEKNGWNEIMKEFERHKKFRNKLSREGMHFLRFWSRKSPDYHTFIFNSYLKKFLIIFSTLVVLLLLGPVWMLTGIKGSLALLVLFGITNVIYFNSRLFTDKQNRFFQKNQGMPA